MLHHLFLQVLLVHAVFAFRFFYFDLDLAHDPVHAAHDFLEQEDEVVSFVGHDAFGDGGVDCSVALVSQAVSEGVARDFHHVVEVAGALL